MMQDRPAGTARLCRLPWRGCIGLCCLLLAPSPLLAADLGNLDGFDIRLDTTLRLSLGLRVDSRDASLLQNANSNEGDRNFAPGPMSERADITSVMDATRGALGFEISADGWYDAIYQQKADRFPPETRHLMGDKVELGTAYMHDRFSIAGIPVTLRLGRQTLLWGETLFFPQDGIAAGQAPVDGIKALSQPLVEANEVFLPVNQAYLRVDLSHGVSLEAYEQLEWRRDRTPGVGSYFSTSDVADIGGDHFLLPDGAFLPRTKDSTPDGFGQFGMALRYASDVIDLGLYAQRYASKQGFLAPQAGGYHLVFPSGIDSLGASASTYVGSSTLAGEVSVRQNMPLVSAGLAAPAGYATGRSLQALVSFAGQLPTGPLWQGASLAAELSTTELLDVQTGQAALLPHRTRFSSAAEVVFTPQYFQVLPQLDLTLPVGVGVGLSGRSSVDGAQEAGIGNITLSVSATYRSVWQVGISLTHFLGPAEQQPLADRQFVTVSLARTF